MSGHLDGPRPPKLPGPPDPPYIEGDLGAPSAEEFARRRNPAHPIRPVHGDTWARPSDCDECGAESASVPGECCPACRRSHEKLDEQVAEELEPGEIAFLAFCNWSGKRGSTGTPWDDLRLPARAQWTAVARAVLARGASDERKRIVAWLRADPVEVVRVQLADLIARSGQAQTEGGSDEQA